MLSQEALGSRFVCLSLFSLLCLGQRQAVYEDSKSVHLVMELCEGGVLMENSVRCSEQEAARNIRSILRFLAQCHAKVSGQ